MIDYEDLILARQEEREILEDCCSGDCDYCPYAAEVPGTGERIDREPEYICTIYKEEP